MKNVNKPETYVQTTFCEMRCSQYADMAKIYWLNSYRGIQNWKNSQRM